MKPTPPPARELFALYHLGVDKQGQYAFRNLRDVARLYNTSNETVQAWLKAHRIDPETVGQVEFNLSRRHVDAQLAAPDQLPAVIDEAWAGYREALAGQQPGQFFHDHDYDDL